MKTILIVLALLTAFTATAFAYGQTDCQTDYFGDVHCNNYNSNSMQHHSRTDCHTDYFGNQSCRTM